MVHGTLRERSPGPADSCSSSLTGDGSYRNLNRIVVPLQTGPPKYQQNMAFMPKQWVFRFDAKFGVLRRSRKGCIVDRQPALQRYQNLHTLALRLAHECWKIAEQRARQPNDPKYKDDRPDMLNSSMKFSIPGYQGPASPTEA